MIVVIVGSSGSSSGSSTSSSTIASKSTRNIMIIIGFKLLAGNKVIDSLVILLPGNVLISARINLELSLLPPRIVVPCSNVEIIDQPIKQTISTIATMIVPTQFLLILIRSLVTI